MTSNKVRIWWHTNQMFLKWKLSKHKASRCLEFVKWSVDEYKLVAQGEGEGRGVGWGWRMEDGVSEGQRCRKPKFVIYTRALTQKSGKCHKLSHNINIQPRNECHISCTLCSGIGLHNAGPLDLWLQRYEAENSFPAIGAEVVIFHILLGWNIVASSAPGEVCQKLETANHFPMSYIPIRGPPYAHWPAIYSAIRNYGSHLHFADGIWLTKSEWSYQKP